MSQITLINEEYLREHPEVVFVFGDNLERKGKGGAAALRDFPNTYGFITKKKPSYSDDAYYRPDEYKQVFTTELKKLLIEVTKNKDKTYIISKIGSGLANRYRIWEEVILPNIDILRSFKNVKLLF